MPVYTYQARDAAGEMVSGEIEGADHQSATVALSGRDLIVISLVLPARRAPERWSRSSRIAAAAP